MSFKHIGRFLEGPLHNEERELDPTVDGLPLYYYVRQPIMANPMFKPDDPESNLYMPIKEGSYRLVKFQHTTDFEIGKYVWEGWRE